MFPCPPLPRPLPALIEVLPVGAVEAARARQGASCAPRLAEAQRFLDEAIARRTRILEAAGAPSFLPEPAPDLHRLWMDSWAVPESEIYRQASTFLRRIELNDIAAAGGDFEGEWQRDPADWPERGTTGESIHRLLGFQARLAREGRPTRKAYEAGAAAVASARKRLLGLATPALPPTPRAAGGI